jgi:hypothetical protein
MFVLTFWILLCLHESRVWALQCKLLPSAGMDGGLNPHNLLCCQQFVMHDQGGGTVHRPAFAQLGGNTS